MAGAKALAGIRVLDLTIALSGPFCSMILGDLGAEVIKVEPPGGEIFRKMGPYYRGEWSCYFVSINRNKRGIVLDLKTEKGLRAFYDLVKVSDVVVDNFRPGVLEKLEIGHSILSEINPRIVTCSITGFGDGAYAQRAAFDICVEAAGGHLSATGDEGGNLARPGVPMVDLATGQFAVIGILAALSERSVSGRGQRVDVSMFDSLISLENYFVAWYTAAGAIPKPMGTGHEGIEPYGAYRAKDSWLTLAITAEKFWAPLCRALGVPELAGAPRFQDARNRRANRRELREIIEGILSARTADEWMESMEEAGVPAAPVNSLDKALAEPCVRERNMLVPVEQPGYGTAHLAGNPVKMSRTPGEEFAPAPAIGEHTTEVLVGLLGYSRERVEQMLSEGAAEQFRELGQGPDSAA